MLKKLTLIALTSVLTLSMPMQISEASDKPTTEIKVINVTLIEPELTVEPLEVPRVTEPEETPQEKEPQLVSLGEFLVSAYCSCYICCEEYAFDRPIDENGNEIVIGAAQEILTPEYSVAVDTRVIPFGTKLYFNGNEYLAQDRGGAIKEHRIDLYFNDHQDALEWGMQYHEVFVLESED